MEFLIKIYINNNLISRYLPFNLLIITINGCFYIFVIKTLPNRLEFTSMTLQDKIQLFLTQVLDLR